MSSKPDVDTSKLSEENVQNYNRTAPQSAKEKKWVSPKNQNKRKNILKFII